MSDVSTIAYLERENARLRSELEHERKRRSRAEQAAGNLQRLHRRALASLLDPTLGDGEKLMESYRLAKAGGYGGVDVIKMEEFSRVLGKCPRTAQRHRAQLEALGRWVAVIVPGGPSAFRPGPVAPERRYLPAHAGRSPHEYQERRARVLARAAELARRRGPACVNAPDPGTADPMLPAWGPSKPRRPYGVSDRRRARPRGERGGDTQMSPLAYDIDAREKYPPSVGTDRSDPPTEAQNRGSPPAAGSDRGLPKARDHLQGLLAELERSHPARAQTSPDPEPGSSTPHQTE